MADEIVGTVEQTDRRPPKPEDWPELIAPEGTREVGYDVFKVFSAILREKTHLGLSTKWNRHYELGKNRHWKFPHKKVPLISANLLYTHRSRTINLLTDNNPTFNISRVGAEEGQEEIYDTLLHTAEFWWIEQEQQHILERSVSNGETFGCSIEKSVFNPDLEYGIGEVETVLVEPYYFGFYPFNIDDIQRSEAVLHFYPMQLREVKRRWPDHAKVVQSDNEILKQLDDARREIQSNSVDPSRQRTGFFGTISGIVKNFINAAEEIGSPEDEVLVVECWCKDYTTIDREVVDDVGEFAGIPRQVTEPLYPGYIRRITTCNAGNIVLEDRGNPSINPDLPLEQAINTYLYDKFPFTLTQSVTDTGSLWGMSDFEQLEALQIEVNKTLSQLTLFKDRVARVKLLNPKDSGVSNAELSNAPGILRPSTTLTAQGIRYLEPPPIPADLIQFIDLYKDIFFLVSGSFELEQAQTPGREVIAYKAIAALIERASTMLRGKIRNYSKMIRERGRMYLSHSMNWYTEKRWIAWESEGQELSEQIMGNQIIIPAKLSVVSGSTMPRSLVQEREEAITLYDKGAIDNQELLKKMDWPEWKAVVKRLQAGPLGDLIEKLELWGVPPEILEVLQTFSQDKEFENPKDVEKAVSEGEIQSFRRVVFDLLSQPAEEGGAEEGMGGSPLKPPSPTPDESKAAAEIRKIDAEIDLIHAKIQAEMAKIEAEKEELALKRAEFAAGLATDREDKQIQREEGDKDRAIKEKEVKVKDKVASKPTPKPKK
jgi:hypothetical protein